MLKPRKRLTRKELKEDKLVTFYFQAQDWLDKNSKFMLIGLAVLMLIIAGSFFYLNSQRNAEKNASVELSKAIRAYEDSDYQNALPLLSNIVKSWGGSPSGKVASFYLAKTFFANGDFDNAQKSFKKFISGFGKDDFLLSSAMAGVAACLEQKGSYLEAAQQYEATANKYSSNFMAPEYLLKAARCYNNANNKEKSIALLDKIINDYPDAKVKDDAVIMRSIG